MRTNVECLPVLSTLPDIEKKAVFEMKSGAEDDGYMVEDPWRLTRAESKISTPTPKIGIK